MKHYTIILADDHVLLRQGIRKILEERSDFRVVAEAGDGIELLRILDTTTPDLIILDMSMPNLRGIEATPEIRKKCPSSKILILSMYKEYVFQAMNAGAHGYVLKDDADRELFSAIEAVRQGRLYLSPRISCELAGTGAASLDELSQRERQVLKLIAEGLTNRNIADRLFISVRTVECHRASIMNKLDLRNTADLVKYALSKGYI